MKESETRIPKIVKTVCYIIGWLAFFILLAIWDTVSMTLRGVLIAVVLLTILGHYKANKELKRLMPEVYDDEFDEEEVIPFRDLDKKTKKLYAVQGLLFCMIIGVIALFCFLTRDIPDDMPICDWPPTMQMLPIGMGIVIFLLLFGMDIIEKKLEKRKDQQDQQRDDEVKIDEKKVSHYMDLIKSFSRNAIQISFAENDNILLTAGCSKYGGRPDVDDDFQWPHDNNGRPLSLLLQIDCADLTPLELEGLLPTSGQLYFFYELSKMNRNGLKNNVRVIYNDKPSSQLYPLDYPVNLNKKYQLQEHRLQFTQCTSIPEIEELGNLTNKPLSYKDKFESNEAYCRLDEEFWNGVEYIGTMLGYAELIEKPIVDDPSDDVLLLQLNSSEFWPENDKMPHDLLLGNGVIYFYIKRDDLWVRRFDRITFARQCI